MTLVFRIRQHDAGWDKTVDELTEYDWDALCDAAGFVRGYPVRQEDILCADNGTLYILDNTGRVHEVDDALFHGIPG